MIKILFICHGNICRSTMAEMVFKDLVRKEFLSDLFYINSAATSREEHTAQLLNEVLGSAVDKRAVLARFIGGIDASDARTLQHLLSSRND